MVFQGKNIVVAGAGVSGIAVAKVLQGKKANVTLYDAKKASELGPQINILSSLGISLCLGNIDKLLWQKIDILVLSPGISINSPLVAQAKSNNIVVISEIEVAYQLCSATIIAVTGTNGKTTTTAMLGEMVKTTGKKIVVGGNIGMALSQEVLKVDNDGIVVAEISSFQLEGVVDFSPYITAILNITPDHIDRHGTVEAYQQTKERIFQRQVDSDFVILNYDDDKVRLMADRVPAKVVFFSRQAKLKEGFYVDSGVITARVNGVSQPICPIAAMRIFGDHNVENALAACACAFYAGVSCENMARILASFPGVEHRIEYVASIGGVKYYNDSKATNPESAIKALQAFPGNIVLIAGGRDKNTDLLKLMVEITVKVDHLILLGEAQTRFAQVAKKQGVKNLYMVNSFSEAVSLAYTLARPPQIVLLSPACSSYDMFNNYEERGRAFKSLVTGL